MQAGALVFFYESTAPPFYAKLFRISNFLANDYDKESINRVYGKMLLTFKLSISKATLHVQGRWNRGGRGGEGHCVLKWGFTWTFPGNQESRCNIEINV